MALIWCNLAVQQNKNKKPRKLPGGVVFPSQSSFCVTSFAMIWTSARKSVNGGVQIQQSLPSWLLVLLKGNIQLIHAPALCFSTAPFFFFSTSFNIPVSETCMNWWVSVFYVCVRLLPVCVFALVCAASMTLSLCKNLNHLHSSPPSGYATSCLTEAEKVRSATGHPKSHLLLWQWDCVVRMLVGENAPAQHHIWDLLPRPWGDGGRERGFEEGHTSLWAQHVVACGAGCDSLYYGLSQQGSEHKGRRARAGRRGKECRRNRIWLVSTPDITSRKGQSLSALLISFTSHWHLFSQRLCRVCHSLVDVKIIIYLILPRLFTWGRFITNSQYIILFILAWFSPVCYSCVFFHSPFLCRCLSKDPIRFRNRNYITDPQMEIHLSGSSSAI